MVDNIINNLKKTCYRYNSETYKYEGEEEAILDVEATLAKGFPVYTVPEYCTMVELPPFDGSQEMAVWNTMMGDWVIQTCTHRQRTILKPTTNDVVFSDINVRVIDYELDKFLSTDAKAVFQSMWRLFTTEEGEIPYFRAYGCRLKKFLHYPLTQNTADAILEYLENKVESFESRGRIVSADAQADISNNVLKMKCYVQVKASGETGVLPDLLVDVNRK